MTSFHNINAFFGRIFFQRVDVAPNRAREERDVLAHYRLEHSRVRDVII